MVISFEGVQKDNVENETQDEVMKKQQNLARILLQVKFQ